MKQAHIFLSGNIQGVGFRQFVKSHAAASGLTGWVRNTEDGGVEAVVQGDEQTVLAFMEVMRTGPMLAEVKHLGFDWEEGEQLTSFVIDRD